MGVPSGVVSGIHLDHSPRCFDVSAITDTGLSECATLGIARRAVQEVFMQLLDHGCPHLKLMPCRSSTSTRISRLGKPIGISSPAQHPLRSVVGATEGSEEARATKLRAGRLAAGFSGAVEQLRTEVALGPRWSNSVGGTSSAGAFDHVPHPCAHLRLSRYARFEVRGNPSRGGTHPGSCRVGAGVIDRRDEVTSCAQVRAWLSYCC